VRSRILGLAIVCVLAALAWQLPETRHRLIYEITHADALPSEPAALPAATGPGLSPVARTRVVVVDGLSADATQAMTS
jgi:hypothetical protein